MLSKLSLNLINVYISNEKKRNYGRPTYTR